MSKGRANFRRGPFLLGLKGDDSLEEGLRGMSKNRDVFCQGSEGPV
jgi:hypothetical protein